VATKNSTTPKPANSRNGAAERRRDAERIERIVLLLDVLGDLVAEKARHQGGDGRHQEDRAGEQAEPEGECQNPAEHRQRAMRQRAERPLGPGLARAGQPFQQAIERDAEHRQERDREPDRLEQHGAEWAREHLGQRLGGGVEHGAFAPEDR
jgi:hypothetical protein